MGVVGNINMREFKEFLEEFAGLKFSDFGVNIEEYTVNVRNYDKIEFYRYHEMPELGNDCSCYHKTIVRDDGRTSYFSTQGYRDFIVLDRNGSVTTFQECDMFRPDSADISWDGWRSGLYLDCSTDDNFMPSIQIDSAAAAAIFEYLENVDSEDTLFVQES